MRIIVSKTRQQEIFTLPSQKNEENPTRVKIRRMPRREKAHITDEVLRFSLGKNAQSFQQGDITIYQGTVNYKMLSHSIVGWENVFVEHENSAVSGEDLIPFHFDSKQETIDLFLDSLSDPDYTALQNFVVGSSDGEVSI